MGASTATPAAPPLLVDVADSAGIDFAYRNGEEADRYSILESLGGGVALLDYNRDGLLDIFLTGGGHFAGDQPRGHAGRLYANDGGWKFRDVTSAAGLDQAPFYTHGCFAADYDNDGWDDLLITGYGSLALYRNCGDGQFEEVTAAAGLLADKPDLHWSTAAAWGDINADGWLDLFVAHYLDWRPDNNPRCTGNGAPREICTPNRFDPLRPQLFLSRGDGTFEEIGSRAGLLPGKALGALLHDIDGDGRLDIYVANDALHNQAYLNRGEGRFREAGFELGVALGELGEAEGSMGIDVVDLDGRKEPSLFVTNYQGEQHAFYHRREGLFDHATQRLGLAALGRNFVGWGCRFLDVDLDGDQDLLITNGHVLRHPPPPQSLAQRALLLENRDGDEGPRFASFGARAGAYFASAHRGRGLAVGDLDNDGRLDAVISHVNEPVAVLRNRVVSSGHWLGIELAGRRPRDAAGAQLVLETSAGPMVRIVKAGGGYLSTHDRRVVFGLQQATAQRLTVRWPSGPQQTWDQAALKTDRYLRLEEQPTPEAP